MMDLKQYEVWFVTGSQHLYGPKTLEQLPNIRARSQLFGRFPACAGAGRFQAGADDTRSDP